MKNILKKYGVRMLAVVKIFQIRGKVILCCGATSSSDSFILHRRIFNSSLIVLNYTKVQRRNVSIPNRSLDKFAYAMI